MVLEAAPEYAGLRVQADTVRVCGGQPTLIELQVDERVPAVEINDGPLPVNATVETQSELAGEVIVWVTKGYLSALELAWYTDEPPSGFPDPSSLRIEAG